MSFGLQAFSASGAILLDTTDRVARVVGEYTAPALGVGGSATIAVPGMVAGGTWQAFNLSSVPGLFATVNSGSFTVTCGYQAVEVTGWIVTRIGGSSVNSGFGFSAIDDSGGVQIDQDYINYVKLASGTGSASGTAIPTITGASIYAVRPSGAGVGVTLSRVSGNPVVTSGTYDWVVYGALAYANLPATGFGMRVYKSDGSVVFDSATPLVRPIQLIVLPTGGLSYSFTLSSDPLGRRPYVSLFNLADTEFRLSGGGQGQAIGPKITFNSNTSISGVCNIIGGAPPVDSGPWVANSQIQFFVDY